MGVACFISASDGDTSYSTMMDGKGLGRALDSVSCMGEDLGIRRLDDFVSHSKEDLMELLQEEINDFDETNLPDEQWYDPEMGIKIVEQYINKLEKYEYIYRDDKEDSLQDLNDMITILRIFVHKGLKWHLSIDI